MDKNLESRLKNIVQKSVDAENAEIEDVVRRGHLLKEFRQEFLKLAKETIAPLFQRTSEILLAQNYPAECVIKDGSDNGETSISLRASKDKDAMRTIGKDGYVGPELEFACDFSARKVMITTRTHAAATPPERLPLESITESEVAPRLESFLKKVLAVQ